MPDVDEVDDVAEAEPVDEVAERAAEQQPERDRQVEAPARPRRGTRRSATRRRATRARTAIAWSRKSPKSAPEFWLKTRRTVVADDLDRLARVDRGDEPGLASAGRGRRPPAARPRKTAHRAGLRAVPLPAAASTGGAAVVPVASPCSSRSPPWSEPSAAMSLPVADATAQGDRRPGRSSSSTVARAAASAGGGAVDERRRASRAARRRGGRRPPAAGPRSTGRSGRRAPGRPRVAGPGSPAGSSRASPSARSSGVSCGVDDHDEALVVGDGRAGPRRWPGSRPRRPPASRRASVTEPSGVEARTRRRAPRP